MSKRAAVAAHKRAVAKGKVVEFYIPAPKPAPQPVPEVVDPAISAQDILREVLAKSDNLSDVVILMRDKDSTTGLVSNMGGPADTLLFMEQLRIRLVTGQTTDKPMPEPPKGA